MLLPSTAVSCCLLPNSLKWLINLETVVGKVLNPTFFLYNPGLVATGCPLSALTSIKRLGCCHCCMPHIVNITFPPLVSKNTHSWIKMNVMIVASVLSCMFAAGMAYPGGKMQEYELEAETQWHLRAPNDGCVEVSYTFGGNVYRSYACDHNNKACIFSAVARCPTSALFHNANLNRIVNIHGRDHLFRYYNQIGICVVMNNMY